MTWDITKIDLTSKNSAVVILLSLDLLFFCVAILSAADPAFISLKARMWELFAGTNSALFLAINVGTVSKQATASTTVLSSDTPLATTSSVTSTSSTDKPQA